MQTILRLSTYLLFSLVALSAQAATINISGSAVSGVSGLDVDGVLYDAIFFDGSYDELLIAYPSPENTTHYSDAFAHSATDALYAFAITDGGFAGVDKNDVVGCSNGSSCWMSTTVGSNSLKAWSFFQVGNGVANAVEFLSSHQNSYQSYGNATLIVWQPSPVPLPAAAWLFGSALLGLFGIKHRKA